MLFCINVLHSGWLPGLFAFLIWSLPGAFGMFGLALGVEHIGETLSGPVYALLSGLNAATVGIIALAAVQLAEKAVIDKLSRLIIAVGGCVGMLYTALWYFPVLMVTAGLTTLSWDYKLPHSMWRSIKARMRPEQRSSAATDAVEDGRAVVMQDLASASQRHDAGPTKGGSEPSQVRSSSVVGPSAVSTSEEQRTIPESIQIKVCTWQMGTGIIAIALAILVVVLVLRATLTQAPRAITIFANLYLAGIIIFGGGPVVIPLLREYVVAEGWVSPRDFLLGLAIIQAFPGPNFNFAVYLGALSTIGVPGLAAAAGAVLGFVGIFAPGLLVSAGLMGVWARLRSKRWLRSFLRGVNALAIGLVFTAVHKLWQIGLINQRHDAGAPLGSDPWWVVITAASFVGGRYFDMPAVAAILAGGAMGLLWFAAVRT